MASARNATISSRTRTTTTKESKKSNKKNNSKNNNNSKESFASKFKKAVLNPVRKPPDKLRAKG